MEDEKLCQLRPKHTGLIYVRFEIGLGLSRGFSFSSSFSVLSVPSTHPSPNLREALGEPTVTPGPQKNTKRWKGASRHHSVLLQFPSPSSSLVYFPFPVHLRDYRVAVLASTILLDSSAMISLQNAGRSAGCLEVTKFPSTTTSLSM